ncbi:MAG TPA: ABC transporter permease [Stellaceae bacterium]|jgi:tungstate transport system permease protein
MEDIGRAFLLAARLVAGFDPELVGTVLLSLRVSLSAALIASCAGVPVGAALAVAPRFRCRGAVVVVLNALLGLPPVVIGLVVYLLLSRGGPLGALGMLFTPGAMVLAQALLAAPIVAALVHRTLEGLWAEYGDALRADGATRARAARELLLIGRGALVTAFLAAFGRAIAEVGAIIVVGGNIRGFTRTMTTAIALETSRGDLPLALALGFVLVSLSLAVSAAAFALNRHLPAALRRG